MSDIRMPIHEQIRSYIQGKINSGEWAAGAQIPSEREISELFHVSRVTVRQAMVNLANEGMIRRVQGQGTFVSEPRIEMLEGELISITTLMQKQGREPETILKGFRKETLDLADAQALGYPLGEEVYVFQRIRKANGIIIVLENTMLPCRKVPGIDQYDLQTFSVFSLMADVYQFEDLQVHQTIEADTGTEEVARLLEIEPGSPVVCVHRVVRDASSQVVEFAHDYYPASRIRFVYNGIINLKSSQQKFRESGIPTVETR
jgi:GntR family transcriptional regulator